MGSLSNVEGEVARGDNHMHRGVCRYPAFILVEEHVIYTLDRSEKVTSQGPWFMPSIPVAGAPPRICNAAMHAPRLPEFH